MLTVGILGGMGPMATVDLFGKIVESTPAKIDQEHLKIIIYNNPQIPSRIDAIMDDKENPAPELIRSAQLLEKSGADILVMPCNTAHYWYQKIQDAIGIKLIHMIEHAAQHVQQQHNASKDGKLMLFATAATVKTGIYQKAFLACGLQLVVPDAAEQEIVALAIQQVKAGHLADNQYLSNLSEIITKYRNVGVNSFIAGCTEVPLLFRHIPGNFRKIDPTKLLAEEVVNQAFY